MKPCHHTDGGALSFQDYRILTTDYRLLLTVDYRFLFLYRHFYSHFITYLTLDRNKAANPEFEAFKVWVSRLQSRSVVGTAF